MNLIREVCNRRRSSSTEEDKKLGKNNGSDWLAAITATPPNANGHASLRRSLLPRSRTTNNDLDNSYSNGNVNTGTLSASATANSLSKVTDWSYCQPPKVPPGLPSSNLSHKKQQQRSTSLGRYDCSRSVTMHDFREATVKDGGGDSTSSTFSTFKRCSRRSNDGGNKRSGKRPLSSDFSNANVIRIGGAGKTSIPTSNSEFFRLEDNAASGDSSSKDYSSLESLLDDDPNYVIYDCMPQYNSLELLDEAEEDNISCRKGITKPQQLSSFDSLLDNDSYSSSANSKNSSIAKGSIHLKVHDLCEQIGSKNISSIQSPPASSQDTDSNSPRSLSPVKQFGLQLPATLMAGGNNNSSSSPSTLSPCSSSNSVPSSNSQTAVASSAASNTRPQVLRLPQSNSYHSGFSFGKNDFEKVTSSESNSDNKFNFFFDIMTVQQRIAKVTRKWKSLNITELL